MIDFIYWENLIKAEYDAKRVGIIPKAKTLVKFGQNTDLGTAGTVKTVMELFGTEVEENYATDNVINRIVSDDAANTQLCAIEGHTLNDGDLTFVRQTATLNGQTPVELETPLARCTRVENIDSTYLAANSTVYVYRSTSAVSSGVPQADNEIHCSMIAGRDKSLKASTSISSTDAWIITGFIGGINKGSGNAVVDFDVEYRHLGEVFTPEFLAPCNTNGSSNAVIPFPVPLLIGPNADVRVQASSTANGTSVTANLFGYLARLTF